MRNFSSISKPVTDCFKKGNFNLLHEAEVSFKLLKKNLHSAPSQVDFSRRIRCFQEEELVMVYLCKERYPAGTYSKLKNRIRSCRILRKINGSAYILDFPDNYNISSTFNMSAQSILLGLNTHCGLFTHTQYETEYKYRWT